MKEILQGLLGGSILGGILVGGLYVLLGVTPKPSVTAATMEDRQRPQWADVLKCQDQTRAAQDQAREAIAMAERATSGWEACVKREHE